MVKPLIALAQPSSGRSCPVKLAATRFYRPCLEGQPIDRLELEQGTSMLTRCFNMLWAAALNQLRLGLPITHFAMLHDDVVPCEGWLNILLAELEATGADVLSAVAPIKNERGLTSTAIDNPADPWLVRRLTMHEVFQLPETFAAEDVRWRLPGACLLGNTGLWICKFDPAWAANPSLFAGFRFLNRIIQTPDGQWVSQDIPEDWDFSKQAYRIGLKVLATRKVPLWHGQPDYHTNFTWGQWPTDLAWLEWNRNWNHPNGPGEWEFPADVEGWLEESEGRALGALARGKKVVEIGSYCGRSSICMAQTAESIFCVDPFDGRETLVEFMENCGRYGVLPKVTATKNTTATMIGAVGERRFDLAFIDGDHSSMAVARDIEEVLPFLLPGALLAFHDYHQGDPGVLKAVDDYLKTGAELVDVIGTLAVVRPTRCEGRPARETRLS